MQNVLKVMKIWNSFYFGFFNTKSNVSVHSESIDMHIDKKKLKTCFFIDAALKFQEVI